MDNAEESKGPMAKALKALPQRLAHKRREGISVVPTFHMLGAHPIKENIPNRTMVG